MFYIIPESFDLRLKRLVLQQRRQIHVLTPARSRCNLPEKRRRKKIMTMMMTNSNCQPTCYKYKVCTTNYTNYGLLFAFVCKCITVIHLCMYVGKKYRIQLHGKGIFIILYHAEINIMPDKSEFIYYIFFLNRLIY